MRGTHAIFLIWGLMCPPAAGLLWWSGVVVVTNSSGAAHQPSPSLSLRQLHWSKGSPSPPSPPLLLLEPALASHWTRSLGLGRSWSVIGWEADWRVGVWESWGGKMAGWVVGCKCSLSLISRGPAGLLAVYLLSILWYHYQSYKHPSPTPHPTRSWAAVHVGLS